MTCNHNTDQAAPMLYSPPPQDVVAIFHASFHPTRGNVLDWHFSTDDDLDVENLGLEFSALPSGLHQIDEDVIYFTIPEKRKSAQVSSSYYHALALFRRRRTTHPSYRGFLLGSLGILVSPQTPTTRARPWRHLPELKHVANQCYSRPGSEPSPSSVREGKLVDVDVNATGEWFESAKDFFDARKVRACETEDKWTSWRDELHDEVQFWLASSPPESIPVPVLSHITPTLALPSLITLLGPTSLTLYRHLLTRRRVLFYTKPPVEYACAICYAAVDMVRAIQVQNYEQHSQPEYMYNDGAATKMKIPPLHTPTQPTRVLGIITLHDLLSSKLDDDGLGWIACTTDALFLEKPAYYDLLVDLTSVGVSSSSTPAFSGSPAAANSATFWVFGTGSSSGRPRPTMYVSVPKHPTSKSRKEKRKKVQYSRVQTRWAWSDAKVWGDLDRVLRAPLSLTYGDDEMRAETGSSSSQGCQSCGSTAICTHPNVKAGAGAGAWLSDVWQLYEDVCLVCAGAWMGTLQTRNLGLQDETMTAAQTVSGLSLKRSFSTPYSTAPGSYAPASMTMPVRGGRHQHGRSISETKPTRVADDRAPRLPLVFEQAPEAEADPLVDLRPHDFIFAFPPTPDTREGLDILLRTVGPAGFPPNLAEAVSKTEGALSVLDVYAEWVVELVKGYAGDAVRAGSGASVGEEDVGEESEGDAERDVHCGADESQGGARTSGIELTFGLARRLTPPPILKGKEKANGRTKPNMRKQIMTMMPRDLLLLDLNPLSSVDVRFLEGLVMEYASRVQIVARRSGGEGSEEDPDEEVVEQVLINLLVKRGWRDLVGVVFGL